MSEANGTVGLTGVNMSETATSPRLGERFQEALGYAAKLHNTQTRKASEVPYMGICSRSPAW